MWRQTYREASAAAEESLSVSINPAGSGPSWNEDLNLCLAAVRAAQFAAMAAEMESAGAPGADRGAIPGQVSTPVGGTGLPAPPSGADAGLALRGMPSLGIPAEDWFESSLPAAETPGAKHVEAGQSAHPTHVNLLAGNLPDVPRPNGEIFPGAIELGIHRQIPEAVLAQLATAEAVVAKAAPDWQSPEWSGIRQDDQLMKEIPLLVGTLPVEVQAAPIALRLTAVVVDGALAAGAVLATVLVVTLSQKALPGIKEIGFGVAAAAVVLGAAYQILSLVLGKATPGMRFAHVTLRTFANESPTRAQRLGRLGALLLSLLPAGLGVLWAFFDRDRLSLHDRLSRTYLRKQ